MGFPVKLFGEYAENTKKLNLRVGDVIEAEGVLNLNRFSTKDGKKCSFRTEGSQSHSQFYLQASSVKVIRRATATSEDLNLDDQNEVNENSEE